MTTVAAISEILRAFQQDLRDIQLAGVNWDELPPSGDSLNTKGKWMDLKRDVQGKRMEALRHSFMNRDKKPKELKPKINYLGEGTLDYPDWSPAITATFMDRIGIIEAHECSSLHFYYFTGRTGVTCLSKDVAVHALIGYLANAPRCIYVQHPAFNVLAKTWGKKIKAIHKHHVSTQPGVVSMTKIRVQTMLALGNNGKAARCFHQEVTARLGSLMGTI
ncbi:hypothetical protein BDZ91DRAFT_765563 [Kalaharituber pfeilii]|nr:hypothetical protein BDZ91DRAFT_765563 [Kalaharituber pfeilii]